MDGWISIGTRLDNKELEKDIKSAESRLKQYEKEAEKLTQQKAKINVDLSAYEKEKQEIQDMYDKSLKQAQTREQVNFELDEESIALEKLAEKYSETLQKNEDINKKIQENVNQQGLLNNQIQEMNEKLGQSQNLDNIKKSLERTSSSMTGIIRKVGKWALAIFSVRSAYMFIRQSISTISQYNEGLANDIEYIRYALANTLAPVINYIINLVRTLLTYVNYIAKAWFGKELFASANDWEKAQKSASKVEKSTKEIKNQMAGFDEMEILSDENSSDLADSSIKTPTFDLGNFKEIKIPKWVQWIADNKDIFEVIGKGLAILFGANLVNRIANVIGSASGLTGLAGIGSLLGSISKLSMIVITITAVVTAYNEVKKFHEAVDEVNKSYDDLTKIKKGQIETSKDIAKTMYDEIKAGKLSTEQVKQSLGPQKDYIDMVNEDIDINKERIDQMSFFEQLVPGVYSKYRDQMQLSIDKNMAAIDVFLKTAEAYDYDKQKLEEVGIGTEDLNQIMLNQIEKIKEVNKYNNSSTQEYKDNINKINELRIASLNLAKGEMQNEINKLEEKNTKLNKNSTEYQKNIDKIKELKTKIQDIDKTKANLEISIEANTKDAEKKTGNFFSKLGDSLGTAISGGLSAIFGGGSKALKDTAKKLKNIWLAKGGIISLPGRGVPLTGNVRGGEGNGSGSREGVLPLTDGQIMSQLGAEIGRNVIIELTNITKLDNRQIAREQKIINAQNDFAFNR